VSGKIRFRVIAVALLLAVFTFLTVANFVPKEQRLESGLWPDDGLRLGLDLQGGIHWVVGVQIEAAETQELEYLRNSIRDRLADDGVVLSSTDVVEQRLLIIASPDVISKVREAADDTNVLQVTSESNDTIELALQDDWIQEIRNRTMEQVLEVLRRRINDPQKGIPESVVTRQGDDRVLVQIPGGDVDRDDARKILEATGFLEFKIVKDAASDEAELRARNVEKLADGSMVIVAEIERDPLTSVERTVRYLLVPKAADITGKYLADARVSTDQQQRPTVSFTFNADGARIFGDLTQENRGNQLAIILDGKASSAPVIQSRISRRGQITGRFTPREAADLAIVLRAGALSVPVVIEEERTVGPALGQDSIDRGLRASMIGLVLILAFVGGYYRLSGGYASIALLSNLVLLVGTMSLFEATLTLPGIAGLVLTVGMAVDANVIIFERIREELRSGKTVRASIGTGFQKATWTVLDANITTLITALILFEFGTGPIKGFAVTLSIGIVTSVFAALVITRLLFQVYPGGRNVAELSI